MMNRKFLLLVSFLLFLAASAQAQNTLVSGTIKDATGQPFAGGTYQFDFYPSPINPSGPYFQNGAPFNVHASVSGNLDSTGSLTNVPVPDNSTITPSGSSWTVTLCPAATSKCFSTIVTITGASQSISSIVPPPIVVSLNNPPPGGVSAYTDAEIVGAKLGSQYFNITDSTMHVCTSFSGSCTWTATVKNGSPANHFQYVSTTGNDANDGLSWGSAKLTLPAAFTACGSTPCQVYISAPITVSADVTIPSDVTLHFGSGTYAMGANRFLMNSGSGIVVSSDAGVAASSGSEPLGGEQVIFTHTGTGDFIAPATPTSLTFNVTLRGFLVEDNAINGEVFKCIDAANFASPVITDVGCVQTGSGIITGGVPGAVGLYVYGSNHPGAYYGQVEHFFSYGFGDGIETNVDTNGGATGDANAPNRWTFTNVDINEATNCLDLESSADETFIRPMLNSCNTYGIKFNSSNVNVIALSLENNGGQGTGLYFTDADSAHGRSNRITGAIAGVATRTAGATTTYLNSNLVQFDMLPSGGGNSGSESALHFSGNLDLPPDVGTGATLGAWIASGFASPSAVRFYCGNGTGFQCEWASRTASTDTLLARLTDAGALILNNNGPNYQVLDTTGTARTLVELDNGNNAYFQNNAGGTWQGINNGHTFLNVTTAGLPEFPLGLTDASLTAGDCVQAGAAGLLTSAAAACGTPSPHLLQTAASQWAGTLALSSGTATFTFPTAYTSAPVCVATDTTAVAAVKASATATALSLSGTGTDVIAFVCVGNPN
jgi:hypothetical protein